VQLRDRAHQRQAEAVAGHVARGFEALEAFQHALTLLRRDAGAGVGDLQRRPAALRVYGESDAPAARREFQRVVEQVAERLREQAAGRMSADGGGLDLVQERAALARSQREAQEMKNAVARGEYAPIGLLSDVLGAASAGVVDRFDQLDGTLRKVCPDLPEAARVAVHQVIASARNEWIRATASLVEAHLEQFDDEADEADQALDAEVVPE